MNQFYRSGKACVKRFIRRRLNKSDDKKQQLVEERNALRETLSAPVSREQASGDLLAEIADIHDMAISRDGNTLYAAIENTNSIVVFDLGQKKILHTFTAPIAKEKSVKHCGGCKDQGVRSLALSTDEKLIYATSFEANALSVINVATGRLFSRLPPAHILTALSSRVMAQKLGDESHQQ